MKKYRIGIYEKAFPEDLTIFDMLSLSAECGYDYFEISIDRTEERISRLYSNEFIEEISDAINKTKIPVFSICLSAIGTYTLGNTDNDIRERGLDIFRKSLEFANRIGARIIQIPACDVPKGCISTEETNKLYIETLKIVNEEASKYGIMIGLENMETEYMDSVKKCMELIRAINSPYFQLYPDSGNITSSCVLNNENPKVDLCIGHSHCLAFHIKETKPGRYGGLFYGEGHVDFDLMIRTAWKLGVRLFVLEYWFTGNELWKKDLLDAKRMVEDILENDFEK